MILKEGACSLATVADFNFTLFAGKDVALPLAGYLQTLLHRCLTTSEVEVSHKRNLQAMSCSPGSSPLPDNYGAQLHTYYLLDNICNGLYF